EIGNAKKLKDEKLAKELMKKAKEIPDKIKKIEEKCNKLIEDRDKILIQIPNIISKETPIGKDESKNVEVEKSGNIRKFDFKVKTHVELGENLGIIDFESSADVSGRGFYYLKKELGLLNQALIRFGIDFMIEKGYDYIETPLMLNEKEIYASMDKNAIQESVYEIKDEGKGLIGTAEQSLLAMHSKDTIPKSQLPKKYFSYSMCFRKEIGAHGINEKGLWRTHQFNKIEQFIFCMPEDSERLYEELLKNSKEILQKLELPYRVLELCSGDLADWKYRSADLEVWRPTTNEYGEIVSLSNCTEYQARKLGIRYEDKGKRGILHTLNNTALATSRIMVAIMENHQQKDGSIKIPKVLHKYLSFKEIKPKK
ncbi:serine--tRNA ligase, partial [Candidatus Pacearchaeota archaeon]|nr:serine--tRNA ligase [Candidatus Pacearchaeota archaeon]